MSILSHTNVDKLAAGTAKAVDSPLATESEEDKFGDRVPRYCVGLTHALDISEYVMLLDVRTGLVYWMDCPKEILEACEPQPSRVVGPLEGEVEVDRDGSVIVPGQEEDDTEASDDNREHETPPTSDSEHEDENDEPDDSEDEDESEDVE
ncbi:hypothetical protein N0V94_007758 [Neodidymelliopsis sp. IMI 364377]|nr:hypothetical protein N0V94_007758 [Neodidymelliopsis sp. IMI 364377]